MKIAIATCSTKNRSWLYEITNKSKQLYCEMHGYDYVFSDDFFPLIDRHPYWNKVKYIRELLDKYDYVLWMDDDAGFISYEKSLNEILSDFSYTEDFNGFNAGVMLFKATQQNKQILDFIWTKMYDSFKTMKYPEQMAISKIFIKDLHLGKKISGEIYNAYDNRIVKNIEKCKVNMRTDGTLILHIANGPKFKEQNKDYVRSFFE